MYSSVPTIAPAAVAVAVAALTEREIPKSMIRAWPSGSIMTFSGFRSRWTTPASCAATRPAAICFAIFSASGTGRRPRSCRTVARSRPSTYGIVMYLMPSTSPRSWMRTTFLCVTCRASSSSRLNRRSTSWASEGSDAITSGRITLRATATASSESQAW
jgi:hypothetical protein